MASALKKAKAEGPRMSDSAVQAKTGKVWKEWFSILDRAGARKMTHQEIAKHLNSVHGVGPWWTQMVAVTYEQERGLRAKHQKPDGYEISVSRTINSSLSTLFKSVAEETARNSWLGQGGLIPRKSAANKSLRFTWNDGKTIVVFAFVLKSSEKAQIVVQHMKLPNNNVAAKMKVFWAKALDQLKQSLEKSS